MTWLNPLLYFTSFAAIFVLFASTIFVAVWLVVTLRQRLVRLLGGKLEK